MEYLSAFDEELVEPCSDQASSFLPPVESEEAVLDEEEVPEVDTIREPDVKTTEELNPAETSYQECKDTISSGHHNNSPFYYFYQGKCNEILESWGRKGASFGILFWGRHLSGQ